jgi:NADH-quinone oxidoreductase subunit J
VSVEQILFWVFAVSTVVAASGVILAKNPVGSAMSLVAAFFFLAGIYVLLWAHTIAVLQILVYAGAIMVLFLFVIMLLSLTDVGPSTGWTFSRAVGGASSLALGGLLTWAFLKTPFGPSDSLEGREATFGTLRELGARLYTQHLLPFEVVSLLLLVAIVGAVVVAKSRV